MSEITEDELALFRRLASDALNEILANEHANTRLADGIARHLRGTATEIETWVRARRRSGRGNVDRAG